MQDRIDVSGSIIVPAGPAMSVEYAKIHIRSLGDREDRLVANSIGAASSYFEEQTGRQLCTSTREVWLDAFPFAGRAGRRARIELPYPPLTQVVSVKYYDDAGVSQTFADWRAVYPAGPYCRRGWVEPLAGTEWPVAADVSAAVQIQIVCGYGADESSVPPLATGILALLVAHFDQNRGAVNDSRGTFAKVPFGVDDMMDGFKYTAYPTDGPMRRAALLLSETGESRP